MFLGVQAPAAPGNSDRREQVDLIAARTISALTRARRIPCSQRADGFQRLLLAAPVPRHGRDTVLCIMSALLRSRAGSEPEAVREGRLLTMFEVAVSNV